ncbi:carbohydrate-binding family 9-like protein [Thalassotalea sp. PLHSN55]|uniref:carbohydrate-binding family 9-like protein n=1 Tax=Thalassotalea sp. PLHSN55 TaxID=3435888 RepID=UPI003F859F40
MTYLVRSIALLTFIIVSANAKPLVIVNLTEKASAQQNQSNSTTTNIDGKLTEPLWQKATKVDNFSLPWRKHIPQATVFKSFIDDKDFYFAFQVNDNEIVIQENISDEIDVASQDRVEIFISKHHDLSVYYCIEIDAKGRVLDYKAKIYRQFDQSWQLDQLNIASTINENGYTIEGKFPLSELAKIGLGENQFYIGLFRADYSSSTVVGSSIIKKSDIQWISWINPNIAQPDFHIPEVFHPAVLSK